MISSICLFRTGASLAGSSASCLSCTTISCGLILGAFCAAHLPAVGSMADTAGYSAARAPGVPLYDWASSSDRTSAADDGDVPVSAYMIAFAVLQQ